MKSYEEVWDKYRKDHHKLREGSCEGDTEIYVDPDKTVEIEYCYADVGGQLEFIEGVLFIWSGLGMEEDYSFVKEINSPEHLDRVLEVLLS